MSLSKLRPELTEFLEEKGITELNPFQSKVIDALKAGKNILAQGPDGVGKTTCIYMSLLQNIKEAGEGSPRGIVICATDQKAYELYSEMERVCRIFDLTIDLAHGRGNMLQQRNDIFDGTEIIIGTPKRMYDLYIQNGYNLGMLKLFILDDTIDIFVKGHKMQLSRIADSLPKCQHLLFSSKFKDQRVEDYLEEFVPVSVLIEAEV